MIPKISKNLKTQDNRATAYPIFAVQQKRRIYGIDSGYTDDFAWLDEDGEQVDEKSVDETWEEYHSRCVKRVGYKDEWEFVTCCFTEQGCQDYIAVNGHNLKEPRIYVYSGYRNEEWQEIRDYLMKEKGVPGNVAKSMI